MSTRAPGIENLERMREDGFHYVDKTGLSRDFLENPAFDSVCKEALKQMHDRNCEEALVDDGMVLG